MHGTREVTSPWVNLVFLVVLVQSPGTSLLEPPFLTPSTGPHGPRLDPLKPTKSCRLDPLFMARRKCFLWFPYQRRGAQGEAMNLARQLLHPNESSRTEAAQAEQKPGLGGAKNSRVFWLKDAGHRREDRKKSCFCFFSGGGGGEKKDRPIATINICFGGALSKLTRQLKQMCGKGSGSGLRVCFWSMRQNDRGKEHGPIRGLIRGLFGRPCARGKKQTWCIWGPSCLAKRGWMRFVFVSSTPWDANIGGGF